MDPNPSLYDRDFYGWTQQQARLIAEGRWTEVDARHLAEEIESMGRSEKHALRSRLAALLAHLLEWQHQPQRRSASWASTIATQRDEVQDLLDDNPSLASAEALAETLDRAYARAPRSVDRDRACPAGICRALPVRLEPDHRPGLAARRLTARPVTPAARALRR